MNKLFSSVGGRRFSVVLLYMAVVLGGVLLLLWMHKKPGPYLEGAKIVAYVVVTYIGANTLQKGIESRTPKGGPE